MHGEDQATAAYAGIPVKIDYDDDASLGPLSLNDKYQSKRDFPINSLNGFIYGLRTGFISQAIIGSIVYHTAYDELVTPMDSTTCMIVAALWCGVTMLSAALSLRFYSWLHQVPQHEQFPNADQDFHLLHGALIGMYFSWLLFDLIVVDNWLVILGMSLFALAGYFYLRCTKESQPRKRRAVSDDLLRSLDLI